MADDLVTLVFNQLTERLSRIESQVQRANPLTERSETAGGMAQSTLALAPTVNVRSGDMLFITDGRKPGEGAGLGTGVPAYWNGATSQWFRVRDDTAVVN